MSKNMKQVWTVFWSRDEEKYFLMELGVANVEQKQDSGV